MRRKLPSSYFPLHNFERSKPATICVLIPFPRTSRVRLATSVPFYCRSLKISESELGVSRKLVLRLDVKVKATENTTEAGV